MLRNRELRRFAVWLAAITIACVAAGFSIQPAAGILALAAAAAFATAFFVFTRERYRRIAALSEQIDLVLHNADRLLLDASDEGELAILRSEIVKMTLRIREQNDALRREARHLADSLADIAHQLRTPLTSANLLISLAKNEQDACAQKKLLRETETLFSEMDWLLTALLQLSRLDAGMVTFQCERVGLRDVLDDALSPLMVSMELGDIGLKVRVPEGAAIWGDAGWLAEAVRNLIKNCMESAGAHGKIEIRCEDNPLFIGVAIHDSGAGFAREELPRLFERFYRGKNAGAAGYGIGLSLARTIIVRQGGTVTAKNHPEGGAVFDIRFPK